MSAASASALSSMPSARCAAVAAAGMKPEDIAVLPAGRGSRSSTMRLGPGIGELQRRHHPAAPAPTTSTSASRSKRVGRVAAAGHARRAAISAQVEVSETVDSEAMAAVVHLLRKGGAAVGQQHRVKVAHMGVAQRRGDAAIGDDAADDQRVDPAFAQHPFQPRHVEGGIGDLLHAAGRPVAAHRPAGAPRRRAAKSPLRRNGRNRLRCGEIIGSPPFAGTSVNWVETIQPPLARMASATGSTRSGSAAMRRRSAPRGHRRLGVEEVVLQIDDQQRRCGSGRHPLMTRAR